MKAAEPTRRTCTPDFPTPPPAVADEPALDEYLSLKVRSRRNRARENRLFVSKT